MRFTDPMPARIRRAHYKPSWRGDSLAAIRRLGKRAGRPAIDINFQWAWYDPSDRTRGGIAFAMHWTTPRMNNYHFYLEPGAKRARRMTRAEHKRPVSRWRAENVKRWRRTASASSARPPTYAQCVTTAKRVNVVVTAELKSQAFAYPVAARYLVEAARSAGHPPWYMALYNMKNVRGKAKAIHDAGGQFAVIFGKFRRYARRQPSDWASWRKHVTRLWGPARWKLV